MVSGIALLGLLMVPNSYETTLFEMTNPSVTLGGLSMTTAEMVLGSDIEFCPQSRSTKIGVSPAATLLLMMILDIVLLPESQGPQTSVTGIPPFSLSACMRLYNS